MNFFDIILLIILFGFLLFGFWFSLLHTAGGVVGTILGVWLASKYYLLITAPIISLLPNSAGLVNILVFFIIMIVASRLSGLVFYLFGRLFHFPPEAPFLNFILRLGGMLLGVVEGALILGVTLYFAKNIETTSVLVKYIATSEIAGRLMNFASTLTSFI